VTHLHKFTERNRVFLDTIPFVVNGRIHRTLINIHARQVVQGPPGPNTHPINSVWIQRSWEGGGQVHNAQPDTAQNRFDWSTGETMYANAITLPVAPTIHNDPSGSTTREAWVLGKYLTRLYASWGVGLYNINPLSGGWTSIGTLANIPVGKLTTYTYAAGANIGQTVMYIPEGATSDVWNGTVLSAVGKSAVSFAVWDDKLFRLGTDGALEWTDDGTNWYDTVYIPDGSDPRKLLVYIIGPSGDPAIHVVTDASVWAYDFTAARLYQTQLIFPQHPDQGRGAATWRGELHVSVGDGIHRYNRSTIGAVGPDRDDGLPAQYRGAIVDLEPSYNALYALVSGVAVSTGSVVDPATLNLGGGDDQLYGSSSTVSSVLLRWNGIGWHYVDTMTGSAPTTCVVSDTNTEYAVWYAANRQVRRIPLSRVYFNPLEDTTNPVVESAEFETFWYNFGWEGSDKIAKKFEMFVERATETENVQVFYKLDQDGNDWVSLGTITTPSVVTGYLFGRDVDAPSDSTDSSDYSGTTCERIKFRFVLSRGATTTARPVIRWFTLAVRQYLRPNRTWRMVLDLTKNEDYSADELADKLDELALTKRAIEFVHQNRLYKVEIVSLDVDESTGGTDLSYQARVDLVESNEMV